MGGKSKELAPSLHVLVSSSLQSKLAYTYLSNLPNCMVTKADFWLFVAESFDWMRMRSMPDHVQVVDSAPLENKRELKFSVIAFQRWCKDVIKTGQELIEIDRWSGRHTWHPNYKSQLKLRADSGFALDTTYWQPQRGDVICYTCAPKSN